MDLTFATTQEELAQCLKLLGNLQTATQSAEPLNTPLSYCNQYQAIHTHVLNLLVLPH